MTGDFEMWEPVKVSARFLQGVYRGFSDCYSGELIAITKTLSN